MKGKILAILFFLIILAGCSTTGNTNLPLLENIDMTGDIWKLSIPGKNDIHIRFFDDGYLFTISKYEGLDIGQNWKLDGYHLVIKDFDNSVFFDGKFQNEDTIKGSGKYGTLTKATDEKIIQKYTGTEYDFSPMPVLPKSEVKIKLADMSEIWIKNPNSIPVAAAVVAGDKAYYFMVNSNFSEGRGFPDGNYEIFFVYGNDPESLYKGDPVKLKSQKVEITMKLVSDGNYGIKKVN